jgi:hypothetical protein
MPVINLLKPVIGSIKRIEALPCDLPMSIYVETAVEALLGMAWQFLTPDARELYHQGRGNSLVCDVKGSLSDMKFIPAASKSKATRFLFSSLEWFDRATWYGFIAAIVGEGLIEWSSQLHAYSSVCGLGSTRVGAGPFDFGAIPDNGTYQGLDFSASTPSVFAPVWSSGAVAVPAGKKWAIACSAKFHDFGGGPVATSSRIINLTRNIVHDHHTNQIVDGELNGANHVWFSTRNPGPGTDLVACQWSYSGPALPLHEAFPDHSSRGYVYLQA